MMEDKCKYNGNKSSPQEIDRVRKHLFDSLAIKRTCESPAASSDVVIRFQTPIMRNIDSAVRGVSSRKSSSSNESVSPSNSQIAKKKSMELPSTADIATPHFVQRIISDKKMARRPTCPGMCPPKRLHIVIVKLALPGAKSAAQVADPAKERRKKALVFLRGYAKALRRTERTIGVKKSTFASDRKLEEGARANHSSNQPAGKDRHVSRGALLQVFKCVTRGAKEGSTDGGSQRGSDLGTLSLNLRACKPRSRNRVGTRKTMTASSSFLASMEKLAMDPLHK